jgi:hypothetical protein
MAEKWSYSSHVINFELEETKKLTPKNNHKLLDDYLIRQFEHNTSYKRLIRALDFKPEFDLHDAGYTCVDFSLKLDDIDFKYGYAYMIDNEVEFVCLGQTYDSKDGEYRNRFVRHDVVIKIIDNYISDLDPLEKIIMELMHDQGMEINVNFYPESNVIANKFIDSRLQIRALVISLYMDLSYNQQEFHLSHMNKEYKNFLTLISKSFKPKKYNPGVRDTIVGKYLRCGQKISPLYHKEIQSVLDINYSNWRELFIMSMVGDLVLNQISYAFPIYNAWTYIVGTDNRFFNNKDLKAKFINGTKTDLIVSDLQKMKHNAEAEISPALAGKLYESIDFIRSNLSMSNVSLLHTMEQVGTTFPSINFEARQDRLISPMLQQLLADKHYLMKYTFELLHGLHTLHTKLGIIHSDIHINNFTYYTLTSAIKCKNENIDMYVEDGKTFKFRTSHLNAVIIDYSRCLIDSRYYDQINLADNFYRDQIPRIMKVISQFASSFVEDHHVELKAIALTNLELLFPVLSCIDFMSALRSLIYVLKEVINTNIELKQPDVKMEAVITSMIEGGELAELDFSLVKHKMIPVSEPGLKALIGMESYMNKYFVESLHKLIAIVDKDTKYRKINFAGTELFINTTFFDEFQEAEFPILNLYSTANKIKYSLMKYDLHPEYMKYEELSKRMTTQSIEDAFPGYRRYINNKKTYEGLTVISELAKQKDLELDGEVKILKSYD